MKNILIINGPNLNLLGHREPDIYGSITLEDIKKQCETLGEQYNFNIEFYQSNHEGDIIDKIHQAFTNNITAIIINAGAFSHTSIAIFDALKATNCDIYEVHLSNIYARESFRHKSYISSLAKGVICGFKEQGYFMALNFIYKNLKN